MKTAMRVTCAAIFLTSPILANSAAAEPNLLFIMDSSNSMWGQPNGVAKIDTVKTALGQLIGNLPVDTRVGLMASGHREKGKSRYFAANSTGGGGTAAVTEAIVVAQADPVKNSEIVVAQATTPKITREVLWSEEFDGFDLVEPWTVLNPNPENYVVEEGDLLLLTTVPNSFGEANAENLITREEKLPRGDWDVTVEFKAEFRTGRDSVNFGLRKDELNYLAVILYTDGLNSSYEKDKIILRLVKVSNGVTTRFDRTIYSDDGGEPGYKKFIDAFANGAAVTLSKRGRGYFASLRINGWVDKDGNPVALRTERLTSLRSPGKLTLGISKYDTKAPGEVLVFFDRIEAVAVESAE